MARGVGITLLDELEVPEESYAKDALRFSNFALHFGGWFTARMRAEPLHGRDYLYSIDRACFDRVLWDHLGRYPTVTRRRFTVTGLLRDAAGVVIGVEGHAPGGEPEALHAPWVVGADGRFSLVARLAGAQVIEEEAQKVSTVYFTDWVGVRPAGSVPTVEIFTTGRGLSVLAFPLPDRVTLCVHTRADRVDIAGDATAYHERTIRSIPALAERMSDTRPVGRVLGLKRFGNGYRTAGGPGWLLAGDAWHYKDPVECQGIYDALLGTRILAEELHAFFAGEQDAAAVVDRWSRRGREATHPMYVATVKRLATELYAEPPVPIIRTLLRWMLNDRSYQSRFLRFLGRDLDPARWMTPGLVAGVVARGIWGDVRRLFGRPAERTV